MRNLVKRYVAAMIRDAKTEEGLTEENFKVTTSIFDTKRKFTEHGTGFSSLKSELKTPPCVPSKPVCLLLFQ